MKEVISGIRSLFAGWVILIFILIYTAVSSLYLYQLTKSIIFSLLVGLVGGVCMFYSFNVVNSQMAKKKESLDNINTYVSIVVTSLKSGQNVYDSLETASVKVSDEIKKDIYEAMRSISEDGDLRLDQFERHRFTALNVFHKNLGILYAEGGDPKEVFRTTTKDISLELGYRDELAKMKGYVVSQELTSLGIVMGIPLVLSFIKSLYDSYLAIPIVPQVLSGFIFLGAMGVLVLLTKKKKDVTVTIS